MKPSAGALRGRRAQILLVEDDEMDVVLTREGFKRNQLSIDIHHVADGVACMAFLRKQGAYADAPTPDLILLDLNLPLMDGREVLTEMVADDALRHLPVGFASPAHRMTSAPTKKRRRHRGVLRTPPVPSLGGTDALSKLSTPGGQCVVVATAP